MPKFHCIHCGQRIDAPDQLSGTNSSCPSCGGAIVVPALPLKPPAIPERIRASKTEKKSSGALSIIGIVIVSAFAGVIGKSCGKSLATNHHTTQHTTPVPPSRNELKDYDVAGIRLLLPSLPAVESMDLPAGVRSVVRSFETYKASDKSMNIAISHAVYINPEVNLDGSADGTIAGVRNLPAVNSFTGSSKETIVDGLPGRELTMKYMNSKFRIDQYGLVFARGGELWQIQIIGEGIQNRSSLEDLKNAIFQSIKISPVN